MEQRHTKTKRALPARSHSIVRIKSKLRKHLPEISERYAIKSLGLFGSYVHNAQRKNSDLDVLVEFHRAPTFFQFIDLEDRLTELLGIKVDLVMKSALKPDIGKRILSEVVML